MLQQVNSTLFTTVLDLTSTGPGDMNADPVPGTNKLVSQGATALTRCHRFLPRPQT